MTIIGAIARPQMPPDRLLACAVAAEEAGLPELWLWEDCFREGGIASSAAALGATSELRVGIGVLPFPLRNVALAAMEIATLEGMFPGRFLPGLGHGVQEWMGWVGARPASLLTLEREYVTALRGLLAGDEMTADGDYVHLEGIRLDWPPASAPRLHLAATGPKSLELAGEIGDGVIVEERTTLDRIPWALERLDAGAARAGRTRPEVTAFVPIAVDDSAAAIAAVRSWADAGVDRVVLQTAADDPDPERYLRVVGSEIAPAFA